MPSVDYAALRRTIPMARVLELLGFVATQLRGDQLYGPCPLHGSHEPADGHSLSVNLAKNAFRCFRCGTAGNQLDHWTRARQLPLYEAVLELCDRTHVPVPLLPALRRRGSPKETRTGNP